MRRVINGGVRCKEKRGDWAALLNPSRRPDVSGEMINANAINTAIYPVEEEFGWAFWNSPPPRGPLVGLARGMTSKAVDMSRQTCIPPVSGVDLKAGSFRMKIATVLRSKGPSLMAVVEDPTEGFLSGPAAHICKLRRCKYIGFEIMPDFTEQHGNGGFP